MTMGRELHYHAPGTWIKIFDITKIAWSFLMKFLYWYQHFSWNILTPSSLMSKLSACTQCITQCIILLGRSEFTKHMEFPFTDDVFNYVKWLPRKRGSCL